MISSRYFSILQEKKQLNFFTTWKHLPAAYRVNLWDYLDNGLKARIARDVPTREEFVAYIRGGGEVWKHKG